MTLHTKVNQMNTLVLAFLGDSVFSLAVKERVVLASDCKAGELNKRANAFIKAVSQAKMLDEVLKALTEQERDIVRRARNSHTANKAKNASLGEYMKATALEALIGYLHLTDKQRLQDILNICFSTVERDTKREVESNI